MTEHRRRDLVSVGDLIDSVLGRFARADVAPVVQLRQHWEDVAGEWASRCRPVGIRNGVLTVEVASGMDASMLRFDGETLLSAVRSHLSGDVTVSRLTIRVASRAEGKNG